jgi:hypothetical protein
MDGKTLPINTRNLNRIYSLGTKREREIHAQTEKIQDTGNGKKPQSLQGQDPADPPGDTGDTGGRDNGKGKSASTMPWGVPKTAKAVEEWYQNGLVLITNLPYPADEKDELLRRLHRWVSAQRSVYQDTRSQVERDHELAQRPQQRECDTESQPQDPEPGRFPDSWDSVVTDPGVEDENPEYMMSGALWTATDQELEGNDE